MLFVIIEHCYSCELLRLLTRPTYNTLYHIPNTGFSSTHHRQNIISMCVKKYDQFLQHCTVTFTANNMEDKGLDRCGLKCWQGH
jgi:hypothetical protein